MHADYDEEEQKKKEIIIEKSYKSPQLLGRLIGEPFRCGCHRENVYTQT